MGQRGHDGICECLRKRAVPYANRDELKLGHSVADCNGDGHSDRVDNENCHFNSDRNGNCNGNGKQDRDHHGNSDPDCNSDRNCNRNFIVNGDRDANANTNNRRDADYNSNRDCNCNQNRNSNSNLHGDGNSNCNRNCNSNGHGNCNCHSDSDRDGNSDCNRDAGPFRSEIHSCDSEIREGGYRRYQQRQKRRALQPAKEEGEADHFPGMEFDGRLFRIPGTYDLHLCDGAESWAIMHDRRGVPANVDRLA
jgi:hypothetical protein